MRDRGGGAAPNARPALHPHPTPNLPPPPPPHSSQVANGEALFPRFHLADPVFGAEAHDLPGLVEDIASKVSGHVKAKIPTKAVTKAGGGPGAGGARGVGRGAWVGRGRGWA